MSLALFFPHGPDVSLTGFFHNQVFVTLGNIVGGGVMVGMAYVFCSDGLISQNKKTQWHKLKRVEQEES